MLKLILADNQAIFRAGIAKVLAVEDEMRIVAQAQTQEQMFMALDKFRAAVLVIAGGFHGDFLAVLQAANKAKTRVVVLADTGESTQRYMAAGAHGVVYRNVTSAALSTAYAKSLAAKPGCRILLSRASLPKTTWWGCGCAIA
jgi:DNA-binding NarL/FixJ family response regulator